MHRRTLVAAALGIMMAMTGCGVSITTPEVTIPQDALDQAQVDLVEALPWNKPVPLLDVFEMQGTDTSRNALRALDHVNPFGPLPTATAHSRGITAAKPDGGAAMCDVDGSPTNAVLTREPISWVMRYEHFEVDNNFACVRQLWARDLAQGLTINDVLVRQLGPYVVAYAQYIRGTNELTPAMFCIAGVLTWSLTQPYQVVKNAKPGVRVTTYPAYLSEEQAMIVLLYVVDREEATIGRNKKSGANNTLEGFSRKQPSC